MTATDPCLVGDMSTIRTLLEDMTNPMAIANLLNPPRTGAEFEQRREEFRKMKNLEN
jgi:hypothetical protein